MSYHGAGNGNPDASSHYDVVGGVAGAPRLVAPMLGATTGRTSTAEKASKQARDTRARMGSRRFKRPSARRQANGKVKVEVTSFWSDWNNLAADLLRPFNGMIDALPSNIMSASTKRLWKTRPLDAQMDILDPLEAKLSRAINRVLAQKGNNQNFFGDWRNLKLVQETDLLGDEATQNLMRRLRMVHALFVLPFTQPIEFAIELAKEGIDLAGRSAAAAGAAAENMAKAAGEAVEGAAKAAGDAAKAAASWFGLGSVRGLGYYGGLGVAGADDVAEAAAAGGVVTEGGALSWVLKEIIDALVGALVETAKQTAMDVVSNGPGVVMDMWNQAFGPKPAPKAPPAAATTAAAPPPPTSSGVSPLVILGGAAAVAFLFLRK